MHIPFGKKHLILLAPEILVGHFVILNLYKKKLTNWFELMFPVLLNTSQERALFIWDILSYSVTYEANKDIHFLAKECK